VISVVSEFDNLISDFSRFYILTLLYERPTHGYGIISEFRKRVGKEISPSLVYPFLKQLEQKGLVKHTSKPVGEKKREIFELTRAGRELCTRLFRRFDNLTATAIQANLEVCDHCGARIYDGGHLELIDGKETTFCCIHCARAYLKEIEEIRIKGPKSLNKEGT
jgi:PadR family transcriptional regulator PadR